MRKLTFGMNLSLTSPRPATTSAGAYRATSCSNGGPTAPNKPTWNLDECRPDVGYWQTLNTGCNFGGTKWFD
ncbi:hypothetical protein ABIB51_003901 [Arthrobacter sp. UYCu712]